MSNTQKQNTFFGGAAILAAGIVLVKIISAVYKMPLINILGSGYTDFTNAFNIFNILLMISTAGIPVAMSRMISQANAENRRNQVHRIFQVTSAACLIFGGVCALAMFFGANGFAALMGNPKSALSMRVLAPSVFFVSGLAAFRGYAQGHQHMTPSSVSQIIEALFKLIVGLTLALILVRTGHDESEAAAGAIVGVTLSELAALVYMAFDFLRTRAQEPEGDDTGVWSAQKILRVFLSIAIPITLTSSATSVITTIDTSLVMRQLQNAVGLNLDGARALFSNYSGVLTVYQIPASLMVAITASVIPAVTVFYERRNRKGAARVVGSALKTASILAFPSGVGMLVLGKPIVMLLFPRLDPDIAGRILSILGIANIFVCMMLVCNSVLQAHNILNLPIITMVIGGVIMVIFDFFVVAIPSVNIFGSPIGSAIGYGITCCLDLFLVWRIVPGCPGLFTLFGKPLAASAVMGVAAWAVYGLVMRAVERNAVALIFAMGVAVVIYFVLLIALRILNKDDLSLMPKGDKIGKLLGIH